MLPGGRVPFVVQVLSGGLPEPQPLDNRDSYIDPIASALAAFSAESFTGLLNEATDRIATDFRYSEPRETHTDDWSYRTGMLQLSAEDGSEVVLDADAGDEATVEVD